jgi:dipeptidyl aminopeptidase/acylaminoacyl peptidase
MWRGETASRDWRIETVKDLRRSIDFLQSRDDVDASSLGYIGVSEGAEIGPLVLAVEPRLRAGVFCIGGVEGFRTIPEEVEPFQFAPLVETPVLMIGGELDPIYPFETHQRPLFEALGTAVQKKRFVLYPNIGHDVRDRRVWSQVRGEILSWLDAYLGPVTK